MNEIREFLSTSNRDKEFFQFTLNKARIMQAGTIAVSLLFLQNLVASNTLDLLLQTALWCFSVSLPMMAISIMIMSIPNYSSNVLALSCANIVGGAGTAGALAGVFFTIYHTSSIAGLSIFLSSTFCFIIYMLVRHQTKRSIKMKNSHQEQS